MNSNQPVALRLVACVLGAALAMTTSACVSVNEKMNADHKTLANKAPAKTVSGGAYKAMPWAVGQWAFYAIRYEDVWSTQRVSIVEKAGDGYWLEVETIDPKNDNGPSRMKMQVKGYVPGDPSSVTRLRLGTVITQNGDAQAMRAPPFIGPLTGGWVLSSFKIDVSKGKSGTAKVPAGTFNGAVKVYTDTKWGPVRVQADTWLHKAIPIWGIARSKSRDGNHEQRLLDFGTSGATTKIKGPILGGAGPMGF